MEIRILISKYSDMFHTKFRLRKKTISRKTKLRHFMTYFFTYHLVNWDVLKMKIFWRLNWSLLLTLEMILEHLRCNASSLISFIPSLIDWSDKMITSQYHTSSKQSGKSIRCVKSSFDQNKWSSALDWPFY